jgi:hypothetical protein
MVPQKKTVPFLVKAVAFLYIDYLQISPTPLFVHFTYLSAKPIKMHQYMGKCIMDLGSFRENI